MSFLSILAGKRIEISDAQALDMLKAPRETISVYTPTVAQEAASTYAIINGSTVDYTPLFPAGESTIVFEYNTVAFAHEGGSGTMHYFPERNGVLIPGGWEATQDIVYEGHERVSLMCALDSWGQTQSTLRWKFRRYDASYALSLFKIAYFDGASSTKLASATVKISEIPK